jgi:hypothetical protein
MVADHVQAFLITSSDVSTHFRPVLKSRLGGLTFAEAPFSAISRSNWSPESAEVRLLFRAPREDGSSFRADLEQSTIKSRKNYVMTKSIPTLTQSGLLAVLLQRQRYAVIQLARRHARRQHLRAAFWKTLTWPFRPLTARTLVDYTGRRRQIHGDLRIQHPEWIEPNGESSMRLMELLDTLTRGGDPTSLLLLLSAPSNRD